MSSIKKQFQALEKEFREHCRDVYCSECQHNITSECSCFEFYIAHIFLESKREIEMQFLKEIREKHSKICVGHHGICQDCELVLSDDDLDCYYIFLLTNLLMEV